MATISTPRATLADLAQVRSKAELIDGRIVSLMPTGFLPSRIALRIARSLDDHAQRIGSGYAFADNVGYAVPELTSGRESFSPDASFFAGEAPENAMSFIEGVPTFAVEVRSENDYGAAAEQAMASKRADYFEAGTLVVWDVDPIAQSVRSHSHSSPATPRVFRSGDVADAEPALPGWRLPLAGLFER